jgi:hypothetical protein
MMNAMLACKPDGIAESHARQKAHEELKRAAGLESSVRKITMQTAAEPERVKQGEADASEPIDHTRPRENRDNRQSVQANDEDQKSDLAAVQPLLWLRYGARQNLRHLTPC